MSSELAVALANEYESMTKSHRAMGEEAEARACAMIAIALRFYESGRYPSTEAMKAAVELEIMHALGNVQTITIGNIIQKAIDNAIANQSSEASAHATHKVGRWLSAALEDPNVCDEMKADIKTWMTAGKPNVQP